MKTNDFLRLGCTMALTACLSSSCVDDKYDLSDVDMTIGTSVDLWLPESSTAPVELASFMNLGDNEFVGTVFIESIKKTIFYAHSNTSPERNSGYFDLYIPCVKDGKIETYSMETMSPIEIGKLPDFLRGDDVHLDLYNPVVIAGVTSENLKGTLTADFDVESYKSGKLVGKCAVAGLSFKQKATYISKYEEDIPESICETPSWLELPESNSFSGLFSEAIPEQLQFKVTGLNGANFGSTELQKVDATVHVGLQLYAPLCVGPNLSMTYVTEQKGWAEEYGDDISDVSGLTRIELYAVIENNAPVEADLEISPIDADDNIIDGLRGFNESIPTYSNDTGVEIVQKEIKYILEATDSKHSLMDFVTGNNGAPVLDGIRVVCRLKNSSDSKFSHVGEYLTTEAAVQMKNIRIRVVGDVSYDAN